MEEGGADQAPNPNLRELLRGAPLRCGGMLGGSHAADRPRQREQLRPQAPPPPPGPAAWYSGEEMKPTARTRAVVVEYKGRRRGRP